MRARHVWTGLVVVAVYACGTMRQDEQLCEEALAQLATCCPGFDVTKVNCEFSEGCYGSDTYPALTEADSTCIREKSCGALQAGICARAQAVRSGTARQPQRLCL